MSSFTSRRLVVTALAAVLCGVPMTSFAQGLADVARASSTTRKEQPKPAKVYTNDNLRSDITPSSAVPTPGAPAADGAAATPADGSVATSATAADTTAPVADARDQRSKDEAQWRARITAAREALERSTSFVGALQSQINGLTQEFVNRDDPAQRAQIEQRRVKAVAELDRTQREVEANRKAITAIEDEARKAGVPAGWLR